MAQNNTLTPKKKRAIAALLQARTVERAAEMAGVSGRSIFRWLKDDPAFVAALRAAEGRLIGDAVRSLVVDMSANHEALREVRDSKKIPPSVRVRATVALDNSLLRWRELLDVEQRLADLEDRIYGKPG